MGQTSCCWHCPWCLGYCEHPGKVQEQSPCGFHGQGCGNHINLTIFRTLMWLISYCLKPQLLQQLFTTFLFTIKKDIPLLIFLYWLKMLNKQKQAQDENMPSSLLVFTTCKHFYFFFVTVTNLHKPSILPPKLHLPKINKPMSRLFGSKGQKMARNWQNDKKLSVTLGMSGSIHHMTVIFGTLV